MLGASAYLTGVPVAAQNSPALFAPVGTVVGTVFLTGPRTKDISISTLATAKPLLRTWLGKVKGLATLLTYLFNWFGASAFVQAFSGTVFPLALPIENARRCIGNGFESVVAALGGTHLHNSLFHPGSIHAIRTTKLALFTPGKLNSTMFADFYHAYILSQRVEIVKQQRRTI